MKHFLLIILTLITCSNLFGIGSAEIKDTYFNKFFKHSIIDGSSTVGKYNLDINMGDQATTLGFMLDFNNDFIHKFIDYPHISQSAGLLLYGFGDSLARPSDTPVGPYAQYASIFALSLAYGWNIYQLPLNTNLYAGFNLYMGSKSIDSSNSAEWKEGIFAPAPYFYFINPWSESIKTKLDFMVNHNWKEIAKLALDLAIATKGWDVDFLIERNGSEFNDSYETSAGITRKFTTFWFFKNVVGIFSSTMRDMDPNDSATSASFESMDKIFGGTGGRFKFKAGTAFDVNNIAKESIGDKIGSADNWFGKLEFGYILGIGLSYKVSHGMGWKVGFNYGIDLDAVSEMNKANGVEEAPASSDAGGFFSLKGKKVTVALEYMSNYINDDIFGTRIDPGLFRINLGIK